ncbi:hypothetical protein [Sphingomonas profundi]|uniref:hypothetical protein n=1 Tax=Alterirhizorhabdus profundi TaxID=2681549 RepID=UPI0012E72F03|nr:hypothetical protein [Sphingomonas profundi]
MIVSHFKGLSMREKYAAQSDESARDLPLASAPRRSMGTLILEQVVDVWRCFCRLGDIASGATGRCEDCDASGAELIPKVGLFCEKCRRGLEL